MPLNLDHATTITPCGDDGCEMGLDTQETVYIAMPYSNLIEYLDRLGVCK